MRISLEQRLPGGVEQVLAVLLDPGFVADLDQLSDVGDPELLEQRRDGDVVVQRIRYRFTRQLSAGVRRVVDPSKLVWVEECRYDLAGRRGDFRILPEHYADRLRAGGTYLFHEEGTGPEKTTVRQVDGELTVRFPVVGRAVERAIVAGLEQHLDDEAALVGRWLAR